MRRIEDYIQSTMKELAEKAGWTVNGPEDYPEFPGIRFHLDTIQDNELNDHPFWKLLVGFDIPELRNTEISLSPTNQPDEKDLIIIRKTNPDNANDISHETIDWDTFQGQSIARTIKELILSDENVKLARVVTHTLQEKKDLPEQESIHPRKYAESLMLELAKAAGWKSDEPYDFTNFKGCKILPAKFEPNTWVYTDPEKEDVILLGSDPENDYISGSVTDYKDWYSKDADEMKEAIKKAVLSDENIARAKEFTHGGFMTIYGVSKQDKDIRQFTFGIDERLTEVKAWIESLFDDQDDIEIKFLSPEQFVSYYDYLTETEFYDNTPHPAPDDLPVKLRLFYNGEGIFPYEEAPFLTEDNYTPEERQLDAKIMTKVRETIYDEQLRLQKKAGIPLDRCMMFAEACHHQIGPDPLFALFRAPQMGDPFIRVYKGQVYLNYMDDDGKRKNQVYTAETLDESLADVKEMTEIILGDPENLVQMKKEYEKYLELLDDMEKTNEETEELSR